MSAEGLSSVGNAARLLKAFLSREKEIGVARLVAEESSPLGPESSGLLVRLAVRFDWHVAEKRKGRIALRLTWPFSTPEGPTASFDLVIRDAHRGELRT